MEFNAGSYLESRGHKRTLGRVITTRPSEAAYFDFFVEPSIFATNTLRVLHGFMIT